MKDYSVVKEWEDNYTGAGIYSLMDENGKRYIGQAINVQNRLETHRRELSKICKNNEAITNEGSKLADAARNGARFKVEILKKLPWHKATVNILRYWERFYLDKFGGLKNTYNSCVVYDPVWSYEPNNEVTLKIDITDSDILDKLESVGNRQGYIKELIRKDIANRPE